MNRLAPLVCLLTIGAVSAQETRMRDLAEAIVESIAPAQDDPDAIAKRLLTAAIGAASSPASEVALRIAAQSTEVLRDPSALVDEIDSFLAASPHGLAAERAKLWRIEIAELMGDRNAESLAAEVDATYAPRLYVAGPFQSAHRDLTGVAFAPEFTFPTLDTFGAADPTKRICERRAHERSIDVAPRAALDPDGCYYAMDPIVVDRDLAVWIEIQTRSSFELFVDDARVAISHRFSHPLPERQHFPLRLASGPHRIVVKLTTPERHSLSVRYVDAAGRAVRLERTADPFTAAGPADLPESPPFRTGSRALFGAADPSTEPALAIAALRACLDDSLYDQASELARRFEATPPTDPRNKIALAACLDGLRMIPSELRTAQVRALVAEVGDALGDHHFMELRRARLLRDEDRTEDAIQLLRDRLVRHPNEPATYAALHDAFRDLEFDAEAARLLREWHTRLPHDRRPVQLIANERASGGDPQGAFDMITEALALRPGDTSLLRGLLTYSVLIGDDRARDRAIAALNRNDPDGVEALQMREAALRRSGDAAASQTLDASILAHADVDLATTQRTAERLLRAGSVESSEQAFERVLREDPSRHVTRRLLSRLHDADEFPMLARFRRDAMQAAREFEPGEGERTSSSTLVIDQMILRFYADGSYVREVHELRRINDQRGVDAFSDAHGAAMAEEVVTVRTILPDGSTFVPNAVNGSYTMPRLQPGAFVEQRYRSFAPAPRSTPLDGVSFLFQSDDEPYRLSELVVILLDEHRGEFRTRRFDGPTETIQLEDGHTAFVFRNTNVERLATEPLAPPREECVPIVAFGEDHSLSTRAHDAFGIAERRTISSAWIAAKAQEICSGIDGDVARARALHDWVHREISDGRGSDPTATLLRGQGARFFVWVAFLREAGVPFRHASLAATIDALSGAPEPLFRGESDFPVPAVCVEPRDGEPIWVAVDNARYEPMGSIAPERRGAAALLLGLDEHELVRLPGDARAADLGWRFRGKLTLGADGDATIEVDGERLGDSGYGIADQVRDLPEAHRKAIARQIASQVLAGWTVQRSELGSLDPGQRLGFHATLSQRGTVQPGGLVDSPVVPREFVATFASTAERKLPIDYSVLDADDWSITFDPGERYRIVAVPDDLVLHSDRIDYNLTFRRDGRRVVVSRRMEQRPGTIEVANYGDFRRLLETIDRAEAAKIRVEAVE
ncbi:MAG: hypothetical protein KDB80_17935 [Planctomycetes bacterium]|nr:hypothetical protein [Planctomycetota bacterium]